MDIDHIRMNRSLRSLTLPLLAIIAALPLLSPAVHAQYFGKNKVQYAKFNYYYIQSAHFDVYFTDGGEDLATFTASAAEEALVQIQREFRYQINARIPFIVYNSHNAFQQTNALQMYLEEGIGGVTELFKNRVIIPFEGSYKMFRHVIHHELVHAVINEMFYGGSIQSIIENSIRLQLPLWFNEGIAEYLAADGWDTNSDMFIRDATTSNYIPPIPYLGGYFAYRGGQSVWWYIAEKYGKQKVGEIVNRVRTNGSVDAGFKAAIGLNVEELSERWMKEQKVLYYPDVSKRVMPEDYAKRLTNHTKLKNFYNTSPAISPAGDRIAFISDRDDNFSLYVMSTSDGRDVTRLVEGQTSADFEELHLLTPGITWSPDGKSIAMSVKAGSSDAMYIIDARTGSREQLPVAMDGIFTVEWSPKGDKMVFVGNKSKQSDIWIYDFTTKEATNLTDDVFSDAQPGWAPDGETLYFESDRRAFIDPAAVPADFDMRSHDYGGMDIYSLRIADRKITRITNIPGASASSPVAAPDGKRLLYLSDRNGISNLYARNLETGEDWPITNSMTGVYQISLSRDGNKLAFATMYEAGFDIFLLKSPLDLPKLAPLEPTEFFRRLERARTLSALPQDRADSLRKAVVIETVSSAPVVEKTYGDISVDLGLKEVQKDTAATAGSAPGQRMLFRQGEQVATAAVKKKDLAVKNNIDDHGDYVVNKYKISFTPDYVYGNGGYNTFYGVLGMAAVSFSDMLGNHQILLQGNFTGELKNSDLALAYFYLPNRIDYGFVAYQTARFLYTPTAVQIDSNTWGYTEDLYRYSQIGGSVSATYPIDKFNRVELALGMMSISREDLENSDIPVFNRVLFIPELSYVHDNSMWGSWSPVKGSRYELRVTASPGIGSNSLTFTSVFGDYRKYYKFWDDFSFVLRGAAGGSFGANPQRFYIGGTENWINRRFETGRIPINSVDDFAFLTPVLPLRGFNYVSRMATKVAVANAELRFPLVKYFLGGVLPYILQSINTAMFVDVGAAVDDIDSSLKGFVRDETGALVPGDLLVGAGMGVRLWFLGFPLRIDVGWPYMGGGFGEPTYYFSLGADF